MIKRKTAYLLFLGIIVLAASSLVAFEMGYFDSPVTKACEEALRGRLKSPSGYKRISIRADGHESISPEILEKYYKLAEAQSLTPFDKSMLASGVYKPEVYYQLIEYDAPNGFGVPLRGLADCEYVTMYGGLNHMTFLDVVVDGQSPTLYISNQIREMNGKKPIKLPSIRSMK